MRFWMVLCLLLACPGLAPAEDRLILASAVCVDEPVITLRHLARAEGLEAEAFLARFGAESLLSAPKFQGARANLSGPKLRELIVQRFGSHAPPLQAPAQIQVQRGGQVVSALALLPAIDKFLTNALASFEGEVEIGEHRIPENLFLAEKTPVQMRIHPVGGVAPGRISLRLEAVADDGRVVQSFTGTVFANVWKTVPCAARVLNRGNILEPELVTFARKNLAHLPRPAWDGRGLPLRMTAPVGEGQVITIEAVEVIPVVQKGKMATLVFNGQSMRLTVPVEILEDGKLGSTIRVRNMQSRKVVAARVIDGETVQVP